MVNSYLGHEIKGVISQLILLGSSSPYPQQLWGLLEYKPQWTLTLQGWGVLLLGIIGLILLVFFGIQPFLAVSAPLKAKVLVVEGWVNDETLKQAIADFKRNHYQLMIITGVAFKQKIASNYYRSQAELTAAKAIALGLEPIQVVPVTNAIVKANRTAASAIAVKEWLLRSNLGIKRLNLYSYDVHTRRSWVIFRRVLSPQVKIGAISYPSSDYKARQWWTASEGVRSVIGEAIAYLYVRFVWRYDKNTKID